jgi:Family of unknown function (DUF6184)
MPFACDRVDPGSSKDRSPPSQMDRSGVTSRQATVDTATVGALATARCNRELSCNNVGSGLKYASRDVCLDDLRGAIANDLNSYTCPGGFDRTGVEHCIAAIENEACDHPLDTIQRIEKCRTDALCAK